MSKLLPQIREGAPAAWKEHCPEVGKMEMQEYIEGIFKGGTYKWHTGDEGMRWLLTDNEMGYLYSLQDHDIRNLLEGALSLEGFCVSNLQYEVEGNVIRTASKLVFYSFYQVGLITLRTAWWGDAVTVFLLNRRLSYRVTWHRRWRQNWDRFLVTSATTQRRCIKISPWKKLDYPLKITLHRSPNLSMHLVSSFG